MPHRNIHMPTATFPVLEFVSLLALRQGAIEESNQHHGSPHIDIQKFFERFTPLFSSIKTLSQSLKLLCLNKATVFQGCSSDGCYGLIIRVSQHVYKMPPGGVTHQNDCMPRFVTDNGA